MTSYRGVPASAGIAIGISYVFESELVLPEAHTVSSAEEELTRLDRAISEVSDRLTELEAHVAGKSEAEHAEILNMQREFLDDPALVGEARRFVEEELLNAEEAVRQASDALVEEFAVVEDEYFRQRAVDIRDVSTRLLRSLVGLPEVSLADVPPASVVIGKDLTPSDTATMNIDRTVALCTEVGSATSHTAIIARSLGIPSVVGLGPVPISADVPVVVDGEAGLLIVDPDEATLADYRKKKDEWESRWRSALSHAAEPVFGADGRHVEIVANVGSPRETRRATEFGAEGVGLLRTEFLFLDRPSLPDEEEQFTIYRSIFEVFPSGPIVVRTLDVGGDKELPSIQRPVEKNPFLGRRGIRLSFSEMGLFHTQLRALLRAAVDRDVRIMFPMVATLDEFRRGKEQVEVVARELEKEGVPHNGACQIGVMIEVPSAAIGASTLAAEVDFFSIGTNDLTQYTLAMDRTDRMFSEQADPFHPSVLFLIDRTAKAAHDAGKWVGMCGEMAGDMLALPLLLGFGIDELSMAPARIPELKQAIRNQSLENPRGVVEECLRMSSARDVRAHLEALLETAAKRTDDGD